MEHVNNKLSGENDNIPQNVEIDVPHSLQHHSWDCGLACTKMVLRLMDIPHSDFEDVCREKAFGQSVWTIDLANLLAHYKVEHLFTTVTIGVDKGYSNKVFYKSTFNDDELRVNDLFEKSPRNNIIVQRRSVTLSEIVEHLAKGNVVIILVDWNFMKCKWCASTKCLSSCCLSCIGKCVNTYQGHFIVACGYNLKEKEIYFKNPSRKADLCCCSMKMMDFARKAYGTDEDVLFIYNTMDKNNSTGS